MADDVVLTERAEDICTITINRPEKRNALNVDVLLRLGDTFNALRDDSDTRVVVLRGAGEKAFSSGVEIGGIATVSPEEAAKKGNPIDYATESIVSYPCPVIAMIYGAAMGAGCDLAVTCDLRILADTARMGINPVKLGLVYPPAGIRRLINVVGLPQAKELFFTGRFIDAQRAKEIGLVNQVVPVDELLSATYALAREIAENAPLAVRTMKTIFNKLLECQRVSAEDEAEIMALVETVMRSEDAEEGPAAFAQRRKPDFKGR
jgi:enoyl-CoA hydratase/carnithine racemase